MSRWYGRPAGRYFWRIVHGEHPIAVVLRVHAPDPYRPKVRILFAPDGTRLELPLDVNLWESEPTANHAATVVAPLNPAEYGIDPLAFV